MIAVCAGISAAVRTLGDGPPGVGPGRRRGPRSQHVVRGWFLPDQWVLLCMLGWNIRAQHDDDRVPAMLGGLLLVRGRVAGKGGQPHCHLCHLAWWCVCSVFSPLASSSATQNPCPVGTYCVAGSAAPVTCAQGTYMLTTAGTAPSSCTTCPTGQYCNASATAACAPGTYQPTTGATSIAACLTCPAGNWSNTATGAAFCGQCSAGYYCLAGSTVATSTVCPSGMYCVAGVGQPTYCPATTFNSVTTGVSVCGNCTAMSYCPYASINPIQCPQGYVVHPSLSTRRDSL